MAKKIEQSDIRKFLITRALFSQSRSTLKLHFSCRVAELAYDSETSTSTHTDPSGKISTINNTKHRISFTAQNVKYISGNMDLFNELPSEFITVINPYEKPFLQWDGRNAEVSGDAFKDGVFDADEIHIPDLHYKVIEPRMAGGVVWFFVILVALFAVFVFYSAFIE